MLLHLVEVLLRLQVEWSWQDVHLAFFSCFLGSQETRGSSDIHVFMCSHILSVTLEYIKQSKPTIRFLGDLDWKRDASCRWILTGYSRRWYLTLTDFQRKGCHFCVCATRDGTLTWHLWPAKTWMSSRIACLRNSPSFVSQLGERQFLCEWSSKTLSL